MIQQIFHPGMPQVIKWTIKYSGGIIKNEKQASYVILGFVVLAIIISLFLIFGRQNKSGNLENFTPAAEASPEELKNNK